MLKEVHKGTRVVSTWMEQYLSSAMAKFAHCPTPRCIGIFRKKLDGAGDDDTRIHCFYCITDICTR